MKLPFKDIKIEFVIRFTETEKGEKAILMAKAENGKEYFFTSDCPAMGADSHLIINESSTD